MPETIAKPAKKKPKPDGEAKPRKGGGGGGGWLRWGLWIIALVLVYALAIFPVRWLCQSTRSYSWSGSLMRTCYYVFYPISQLYEGCPPVRRFYDRGFALLGLR